MHQRRKTWFIVSVTLVLLALIFSNQGFRTYWQRKKLLKKLEKQKEDLIRENLALEIEVKNLKNNPKAIEAVARRELGVVAPGEIEYRFVKKRQKEVSKKQ